MTITAPTPPHWIIRADDEEMTLLGDFTTHSMAQVVWHGFRLATGDTMLVRSNADGSSPSWFMVRGAEATYRFNDYGERRALDTTSTVWAEVRIYKLLFEQLRSETDKTAELAAETARADAEKARFDKLVRDAHVFADGKGWCEQFDDLAAHLGLPKRIAERTVVVTVPVKLEIPVGRTRSDVEAEGRVNGELLANALYNTSLDNFRSILGNEPGHEVIEVTQPEG